MKKMIFIFILTLSASLIFAQEPQQDSVLTKKEKRKAELEQQYQLTKEMIKNKDFVLESDYLLNRYGDRFMVSSVINFVKVEPNNEAVIHVGNNYAIGPNGVGGVTAKGRIVQWDVTAHEKNKSFNIMMTVSTPIGIYDVNFQVSSVGKTLARLTGAYGGRLTFEGDLVPNDESVVYEGTSI